jgi:hypothetical protein
MLNTECHLQDRPLDWEQATDAEHLEALLDRQRLLNPFWMDWIKRQRPQVLTRSLLKHERNGGYLSPPARKWLGRR